MKEELHDAIQGNNEEEAGLILRKFGIKWFWFGFGVATSVNWFIFGIFK